MKVDVDNLFWDEIIFEDERGKVEEEEKVVVIVEIVVVSLRKWVVVKVFGIY